MQRNGLEKGLNWVLKKLRHDLSKPLLVSPFHHGRRIGVGVSGSSDHKKSINKETCESVDDNEAEIEEEDELEKVEEEEEEEELVVGLLLSHISHCSDETPLSNEQERHCQAEF
jgi:hypothetical protein